MVERYSYKVVVDGSSPSSSTTHSHLRKSA